MSKIASIFPRQGTQACGMGQDLCGQTETGKRISDKAAELMGFPMPQLCSEENDRLGVTEYIRAAMVIAGIAMMRILEENGTKPDAAAGFSPGGYCAPAVVGVMGDEDVTRAVRQRGILVQETIPVDEDAMAAILALSVSAIKEMTGATEDVWITNYNCPGQIVISGEKAAVEDACGKLEAVGAKRTVMLSVSGPFHPGMLVDAGEKLGEVLSQVELHEPQIPYVANVTARHVKSAAEVKELLTRQIPSSVRWQQSVEAMIADSADTPIEIGPGKTLVGLMEKISRDMKTLNVEKLEDINKVVEALKS